ncbi:response regulator transcription factor [Paenibacillus sp. strain BS8-2]
MVKILVVDDDSHIRELIGVLLSQEGYLIEYASDGQAALAIMDTVRFDLIILDIMMPNMDGWTFCQEVRTYYSDTVPILMLTAKGETTQKVKGFNLGADDYVVKPFEVPEFIARVKVLLKRHQVTLANQITFGNVVIDRATYKVEVGTESMTLPLKEFELLYKLATHQKKTFSREQLIEDIWGFDYEGDDRTVDVHIKRLRQRFSQEDCPFVITTIRGLGYRLEVLR